VVLQKGKVRAEETVNTTKDPFARLVDKVLSALFHLVWHEAVLWGIHQSKSSNA
jgi:hypothetical protein